MKPAEWNDVAAGVRMELAGASDGELRRLCELMLDETTLKHYRRHGLTRVVRLALVGRLTADRLGVISREIATGFDRAMPAGDR